MLCYHDSMFCDHTQLSIDGYGCSVHKGWNCIDTASNYRDGRGEIATGYALRSLRTANVGITRDMLFIRCALLALPCDLLTET